MSHFASQRTYNELMSAAGHSPSAQGGFTQYQAGHTLVGFRPYRDKDVKGHVHVLLAGHGPVWARLVGDELVSLLGWGATNAWLSDFSEPEQARLLAHKRTQALDGVARESCQIACCPVCAAELGQVDYPRPLSSEQAKEQQAAFTVRCAEHPTRGWTSKRIWL